MAYRNAPSLRIRRLVLSTGLSALVAGLALASPAAAQAPAHVAIVGTVSPPTGTSGTTGVFYVGLPTTGDPGGKITRLAPLPPQLTIPPNTGVGGAFGLEYRAATGTLFVTDGATANQWHHVHILELAGAVVTRSRSVRIGQLPNVQGLAVGVSGLALLPDGRLLIAAMDGYVAGPMRGSPIAILDDRPTTPTVTPVQIAGTAFNRRFTSAVALSPDGKTAYLTTFGSLPSPAPSKLYAIDLAQTGPVTPVLLHTWTNCWVPRLTAGPDGVVHAACIQPGNPSQAPTIEEIRIRNNTATVQSVAVATKADLFGPALVRATGQVVFASPDFGSGVHKNSVLLGTRSGQGYQVAVLAAPPAGGWGMPISVEVHDAFATYGSGTAGANTYAFAEFPNPGGLPEVGNAGFSLTVRATPAAPMRSFVMLGVAPADQQLLGIRLLVDPNRPHVLVQIPAAASTVLPLPIPNDVSLRGATLFAQSAHADAAAGLATSNAVRIQIR